MHSFSLYSLFVSTCFFLAITPTVATVDHEELTSPIHCQAKLIRLEERMKQLEIQVGSRNAVNYVQEDEEMKQTIEHFVTTKAVESTNRSARSVESSAPVAETCRGSCSEMNPLTPRQEEPIKRMQTLETDNSGRRRAPTRNTADEESIRKVLHRVPRRSESRDRGIGGQPIITLDPTSSKDCGIANIGVKAKITVTRRVTGGQSSTAGQLPWMAYIRIFGQDNNNHTCGGVLISGRHVLTAAHCFKSISLQPGRNYINDSKVKVSLGLHRKSSSERHSDSFVHKSSSLIIFLHENYNTATLENDIALIQLNKKVEFNDYIKPICIPSFEQPRQLSGKLHIAGWGHNASRHQPDVLQYASVEAVTLENCKKQLKVNTFPQNEKHVTGNHICAGGNGTESCMMGDEGGPLMYEVEKDRWAVIGIFSWGSSHACDGTLPGVYLDIGPYVHWIKKTRQKKTNLGAAALDIINDVLDELALPPIRNLEHQLSVETINDVVKWMLPRIRNLERQQLASKTEKPDCFKEEMPRSCQDLKCLGYKLNGFYSVKSAADGNKIETVFCNFTQTAHTPGFGTRIRYV